ncbi:MAG: choice-of-anchor E domain-containing protein [Acidimicrobiia bacterium]
MALEAARPDRARSTAVAWLAATLVATGALLAASPAGAAPGDVTTCHDAAIARQRTEIDADAVVPQFDGALGTLLEVTVPVQSVHLDTDAAFENMAATAVTFAEQMSHSVTFTSPAGLPSPAPVSGTLVRIPTQVLAAFDGTLDYVGASAVTQPSVALDDTAAPVASTDPGVLAAFTGTGTMPFHVTTSISETFTGGGGNVQAAINTYAAANVQVCYRYQPVVVVPPTVPPTVPPAIEVAGARVTKAPTLPETGVATLPLAVGGAAAIAVGSVLVRRFRAATPSLLG